MATSRKKGVAFVFHDRADAERAVEELHKAGFRDSQIGIVSPDKARKGKRTKEGTYAEEGAVTGLVAGAGAGALVGLGILAGVIPAIGPAVAGGTLAMMLANAAGGAAIAGLAGALIGMGIPEEEAEWYEGELKSGRTVVTVTGTRLAEAEEILRRHNGYNRASAMTATTTAAATKARTTTTTAHRGTSAAARKVEAGAGETLELHEEKLEARKRPVKAGEVRVRKEVVAEHKTIDVPVTREEVVIERRPAFGEARSTDIRPGEEIRIPVSEEQVDVRKRTVAREQVRVGKRAVHDTKRVSGTVRKERARVESQGDMHVEGTAGRTRVTSRKK